MVFNLDEQKIEKIAREKSLEGMIQRGSHEPPFKNEVWDYFDRLSGGRTQLTGEYRPAYERAYAEAAKYLQDIGVLTTNDNGAFAVIGYDNDIINPRTPAGETLYFVDKKDAEQYALLWTSSRNTRVRKLSPE